jgi:hypothetical protein
MSLLDKLLSGQSLGTSLNGASPPRPSFQLSTLHNQYSTIGDPTANAVRPLNGVLPQPSQLEKQQPPIKYLNNLPG